MANTKEYVIQLSVNGDGAIQNIDKVEKSLDNSAKSASSVKSELRAIQKELASLPQGSEEFNKLAKRAGELRDQINDASEAIRANAGNSIEVLSNNVGNLSNRFATLDFDGLTQDFKGIAGSIGNVKADDLSKGIKAVGNSFAALGKALLGNPIFLIAATIIGIGAALVSLKDKIKPIGDLFDFFGGIIDSITGKIEAFLQILGLTASEAEKANQQVIDSSAEVLYAINKRYDREIKLAQAAGKETIFLEIEKRKAQLKTIDDVIKALIAKGTIENSLNEEELKKLNDLKQQKLDIETDLQATILAETRKNNEKRAADEQKVVEASKQAAAERKKQEEELIKVQREAANKVFEINRELRSKIQQLEDEQVQTTLSKLISADDERFKNLEAQESLRLELIAEGQDKEIQLVDQKYIKLREQAAGNAELLKQLAESNAAEVAAIEEKYIQQRKQKEQEALNTRLDLASSTLGAIANLTNSFTAKNEAQAKKQFEVNKAVSIADALIQTYKGVNAAFASAAANPATVPFPAYPFIQAGLALAGGIAQVNKIRQTKFGSTGGGGSASISAGGGGAPQTGTSGAPTFNPINTQFLGNRPPQPAPAYVLSGAVTDAQVADQKIKEQARL